MGDRPSLFPLDDFAQLFLRNKTHHEDVRTEDLAEAFRATFDLPAFPGLDDLHAVCERVDVKLSSLPLVDGIAAVNLWTPDNGHQIFLEAGISTAFAETTLCHELREVIEQAFGRAKPSYVGIETHSPEMHGRSERFAGTLLMQRSASLEMLKLLGYDLVTFAVMTRRSLPSVIMRARELFAAKHGEGVFGGAWLFEAPWNRESAGVGITDLRVTHEAHFRGFSLKKGSKGPAVMARPAFPRAGSSVADFVASTLAFRRRRPVLMELNNLDLFGQHNFLIAAEPILNANRVPSKIVMTAVRRDFEPNVQAWIRRLNVGLEEYPQSA